MAPALRNDIRVYENAEALSRGAADLFATLSKAAIESKGGFRAALSGGSTPLRLYSLLAAEPYRSRLDWKRIELFIGDERCVPPDHKDSNFRTINEALLSRVPAASHMVHGDLAPRDAAIEYEEKLRRAFGMKEGFPVFDLALLGLGKDGHTASLFPGTSALEETERLAVAVEAEGIVHPRVTLTRPVINAAITVVFMVSGGEKAGIVKAVIEGDKVYPASRIAPLSGRVTWLLDKAAASLL